MNFRHGRTYGYADVFMNTTCMQTHISVVCLCCKFVVCNAVCVVCVVFTLLDIYSLLFTDLILRRKNPAGNTEGVCCAVNCIRKKSNFNLYILF